MVERTKEVLYVFSKGGFELRNWVSRTENFLVALGELKDDQCVLFSDNKESSTERLLEICGTGKHLHVLWNEADPRPKPKRMRMGLADRRRLLRELEQLDQKISRARRRSLFPLFLSELPYPKSHQPADPRFCRYKPGYVRIETANEPLCTFVMSRPKVAPLVYLSISTYICRQQS